jgi:Fe-S cluster assembly scaffold protein SufB
LHASKAADSVRVRQDGTIAEDASIHWHNVTAGAGESVQDLVSTVTGSNGESRIAWLIRARGKARLRCDARNAFTARGGRGEVDLRCAALDAAKVASQGMLAIGPKGTHTQTYLTQKVLLLDAKAHADLVPGLDIRTNDVKASHSATVSRVSPEDLFYFGARGIEPGAAKVLAVRGFLEHLLLEFPDDTTRARALAALDA